MLIKYSKIILTIKSSLILILFISMFFFQKNALKDHFTSKLMFVSLGINHKSQFKDFKKKNTFFISIMKNLAFISLMPLILNILLTSPDMIMAFKSWFSKKSFKINLEFHFDQKFKMFFSVALFVSWSMMEFSYYYMHKDPQPKKFFRLLIIFLLKMIMLTSSNKIFLLFMGWEGVGFLSFLLISWWFTREKANKSAMQAVVYKRIGDMGMLLFFSISLTLKNSWSLSEMTSISDKNMFPYQKLLLAGAILAAAGKSAQFGLHPWLPAAMEGPTPVSALLHSSTMVVAGIFLLVRISPLYQKYPTFKNWCLILGSLTALFAATTAISQHDMKKMVAYSTTSQLGLMMVAIGLNQPNLALFHMCTHAFFKAMLFLSSGSMIHSLNDEQDLRKMGGLYFLLPKTSACILLGSLALSGIPFLAGFYSKDLILEISLVSFSKLVSIMLAFLATLLTSVYSMRIIYFCFFTIPSFLPLSPTKEENSKLIKSLKRLAFGTILSGWIFTTFIMQKNSMNMQFSLKTLAFLITIMGIIYSMNIISKMSKNSFSPYAYLPMTFTSYQWFYEKMSHYIFLYSSFFFSLFLSTRKMDQGWNEKMGAQGIAHTTSSTSQNFQYFQTGYMKQYLLTSSLIFLLIIMIIILMPYLS